MGFPVYTYTFTNSTTADASQVNQDFTDILNGVSDGTKNINVSAGTFAGALNANGAVTLGASSSNNLTINASLNSSIVLSTQTSFDIGSATVALKSIYLGSADATAHSVRLLAPNIGTSYTLTLPTAAPASSNSVMTFTTGGVGSFTQLKGPTVQQFLSGSGTYTPTAGTLWIRVIMVGGGGGGAGGGTSAGTAATDGGDTTFGTSLHTAGKGTHGGWANGFGGNGGVATLGAGGAGVALSGSKGGGGTGAVGVNNYALGGGGGSNSLGGAVPTIGVGAAGRDPAANTGAGGSGGSGPSTASATFGGDGGGAGAFMDFVIASPAGSYAYSVGASGSAGGAGGGGGGAGANGAAGQITVYEYYS